MKKLFVILMAVALVGAFSVTAMAGEWSFYGNARMATYWADVDPDAGGSSDGDLQWDIQGNSRIGAKAKANDAVTGYFEYGTGINMRKLYATWNFGAGTLLLGHTYTPFNQFISGQVHGGDNGLLDSGTVYGGRHAQVRATFGDWTIAFIDTDPRGAWGSVDEYLPRIETAISFPMEGWSAGLMGAFQQFDAETLNEEVTSWAVGGDLGFNFGPAYLKFALAYGDNDGEMWGWNRPTASLGADGKIIDNSSFSGAGVFGFKVTDALSFEAGVGYLKQDSDVAGAADVDFTTYYAQSVIMLGPGVFFIPEVGLYDYETTDTFYIGSKWQINF